jgi:hypothetical protein
MPAPFFFLNYSTIMSVDSSLAAISVVLPSDKAQLLANAVHKIPNSNIWNPSLVIVQAISNLESSGQLSEGQAQSLKLALNAIEKLNDPAFIKPMDESQAIDSLRNHAVHYDTAKIDHEISTNPFSIPPDKAQPSISNWLAPNSKITSNPSAAELPTPIAGPPDGDRAPPNDPEISEGGANAPDDGATQSGDASEDKGPTIEVNAEDTESSPAEV